MERLHNLGDESSVSTWSTHGWRYRVVICSLCLVVFLPFSQLAVTQPASASLPSVVQKYTCDFLRDTDRLDQLDFLNTMTKFNDLDEGAVLSMVLFGIHIAVSHFWCSLPQRTFQKTATHDRTALRGYLQTHPKVVSRISPPRQPEVGYPVVQLPNFYSVEGDTAAVNAAWTVTDGLDNFWEETCYDSYGSNGSYDPSQCSTANEYTDYGFGYYRSGSVQVPLNQIFQIYLQPDLGSLPSRNAWVGSVPVEVSLTSYGTETLIVE
jgi:hypothetical protein